MIPYAPLVLMEVLEQTHTEEVANHTCLRGFKEGSLRCMPAGWEIDPCKEILCPPLTTMEFGQVNCVQDRGIDDLCNFTCPQFYVSNSPLACEVQNDVGHWSGAPECIEFRLEDPTYCSELQVLHGAGCSSMAFGERCEYLCDNGYGSIFGAPLQTQCWIGALTEGGGRFQPSPLCAPMKRYCPDSFGCASSSLNEVCQLDCGSAFVPAKPTSTCSVGGRIAGSGLWLPVPKCIDRDECLDNPCPTGHACVNVVGSYFCAPKFLEVAVTSPLSSMAGGDLVRITLELPPFDRYFSLAEPVAFQYYLSVSYGTPDGKTLNFPAQDVTQQGYDSLARQIVISFATSPGTPILVLFFFFFSIFAGHSQDMFFLKYR